MPSVKMALNSWKRRQFEYGDADCCQFASHIVKEMTGKDYASRFEYQSESEANDLIAPHGSLLEFIESILGEPSSELKDGDPCVVELPLLGQVCGIKYQGSVVCITSKGMKQFPDRYLIQGWSA